MLLHYMHVSVGRLSVCLMLLVLIASSCKQAGNEQSNTLVELEQRDPQAEFEHLRDTAFSTPQEGIEAAKEYLKYFYDKDRARMTEVTEILTQYQKMDFFTKRSFFSYSDFVKQSREYDTDFSSSNYEGVKRTWQSYYDNQRRHLLGQAMDGITKNLFHKRFTDHIEQTCKREFKNWKVLLIDTISLTAPTLTDDGCAKKASGTYRVHLRASNVLNVQWKPGKGFLKRKEKDASIAIKGTIGYNKESGVLESNFTDSIF